MSWSPVRPRSMTWEGHHSHVLCGRRDRYEVFYSNRRCQAWHGYLTVVQQAVEPSYCCSYCAVPAR
jgi:hypothetical protein